MFEGEGDNANDDSDDFRVTIFKILPPAIHEVSVISSSSGSLFDLSFVLSKEVGDNRELKEEVDEENDRRLPVYRAVIFSCFVFFGGGNSGDMAAILSANDDMGYI